MSRKLRTVLFVSAIVLAAMACAFIPDLGGGGTGSDDPNILFQDDFSDSGSGWEDIFNDETGFSGYDQGGFRLRVDQANYDYWANPNRSFSDTTITVDATKIGGPDDNDFGLICRYTGVNDFYFFLISSDGYYGIGKYTNGDSTLIGAENFGQSELIRQGNATNTIQADCVGTSLRLYVNGNLLQEVNDSDHSSGDVGIIAGTFDTPGTDILFDNFVVKNP